MHDQHLAGGEVGEKVLGPSPKRRDLLAPQALGEALGQGKPQVRAPLLDGDDAGADQGGLEPPPHRLDLGKFRHRPLNAENLNADLAVT
jgi:hypothetical protein